jgi:hypothetical protein
MDDDQVKWRRILLFLPISTPQEIQAAADIRTWLQRQADGFSVSSVFNPAFWGYYRRRDSEKWEYEPVCMLIFDDKFTYERLQKFVELLHNEARIFYFQRGKPQETIFISTNDLLFTTLDPIGLGP